MLIEINSQGLTINTDIDLFNQFYKGKIIGVTGTNGKTTFVNLLTDYLNSGKKLPKKSDIVIIYGSKGDDIVFIDKIFPLKDKIYMKLSELK